MSAQATRAEFARMIKGYLQGGISEKELYYWNCGFTDSRFEDPLLRATWAAVHQIHEINPDFKTTREELEYLYECLIEKRGFADDRLRAAQDEGVRRRYDISLEKRKN